MITEDHVNNLRRVVLAQDDLVVAVLPELGAKIETLRRASSTHNVLLQPPERAHRRARYGSAFEEYDTSGFDECFPTVAASPAPDAPGVLLPDHGELWSTEWRCERDGDGLMMEADEKRLPYLFRRRLTIRENRLRLDYELVSKSENSMRVLWSAHPLLAASPGSRIFLPAEAESVLVNSSTGDRLGAHGERCAWPIENKTGTGDRLDVLLSPDAGTADKLFTERLNEGWCAFHDARTDESVTIRFDVASTPYIGIWICAGGWPLGAERKRHYTVALEPCSGRPDELMEAAQAGECWRLEAGAVKRWWLEIELNAGEPAAN